MSKPDGLEIRCGQLFSVGFDGAVPPTGLVDEVANGLWGGVTLFGPNVVTPGQVAHVVGLLREAAPPDWPFLVSVDQEGGRVQRLREPLTVWPSMQSVGLCGDLARSQTVGRYLGEELAALGIGWNLAPVLDVSSNPANPVIGDRAFSREAEAASQHALAFWRGLRGAGLVGCGKHALGHGDTALDSHVALPIVRHSAAELRAREMVPFQQAISEGAEALMAAHVVYPAFDGLNPASLSPRILQGVLREEWGFEGLLVSDDMSMGALSDCLDGGRVAVRALMAGIDHFLVRRPICLQQDMRAALYEAARSDRSVQMRVEEASDRFLKLKSQCGVALPQPGAALPSLLGTPAHKALAGAIQKEVAGQS